MWDQWLHWQNSTDDHRDRQAVQRELQKMLNSSPVSSPGAVSLVLSFLFSRNHVGQFTWCRQPCVLIPFQQEPCWSVHLVQSALFFHSFSAGTMLVSSPGAVSPVLICFHQKPGQSVPLYSQPCTLIPFHQKPGTGSQLPSLGCVEFEVCGVSCWSVKWEWEKLLISTR